MADRSVQMPEELAKAVALKYHEKATTLELLKVYMYPNIHK